MDKSVKEEQSHELVEHDPGVAASSEIYRLSEKSKIHTTLRTAALKRRTRLEGHFKCWEALLKR
jgi:hypothetical protein